MFLCNDMNRNLILTLPRDVRDAGKPGKQSPSASLAVNKKFNITVKPGINNQVEIPTETYNKMASGSPAFDAYIASKRIRVDIKKRIKNERPLTDKSGDAVPIDKLKDTKNAKTLDPSSGKTKTEHKSKSVELVPAETPDDAKAGPADDAPAGGKK